MKNRGYDSYKLIIQEQRNFDLIALVEYYQEGKLVDTKRSVNQNFIKKLINQATVDMKKIKMNGNNLEITGKFEGQIIIRNYREIRKRRDFWELNKKVRKKLPKKELNELTGVKNLKVTKDNEKIKKVKLKKKQFLRMATLTFIITSQIAMINKLLPEFDLSFNKAIESNLETDDEYDDSVSIKNVVSTIEKNYSVSNPENGKINILTQEDKKETEKNQNIKPINEENIIEEDIINTSEKQVQDNKIVITDTTDENGGYQNNQYQEIKTDETIEEKTSDIISNDEIIKQEKPEIIESKVSIEKVSKLPEVIENHKMMNSSSEQQILPNIQENIEIAEVSLESNINDNSREIINNEKENIIDLEEKDIIQSDVLIEENNINEENNETEEIDKDNTEEITVAETIELAEHTEEPVLAQEFRNNTLEINDNYHSSVPTYQAISYNDVLTESEFNQLVAMVQAEAGGTNPQDHYTDALAVTSTVLNRLEDEKWRNACGDTIMKQVHASDQFLGTESNTYRQVMNNPELASPEVVQAVKDCLSGTRNSPYLSFRAKQNKAPGRTQFVDGGNNYFGLPEIVEVQTKIEQSNIIGTK